MIAFENQIVILRTLNDVFAFVSNFENLLKWNYHVIEVRKTSKGPPGEGTIYHQVRKTDEQDFGVIEYQPSEKVTIKTLPRSRPAFEMRFTVEWVAQGTTLTEEWKLETGKPGLLEKLAAGQVKGAALENLEKLKQLMETGRAQLQDGRVAKI